MLQAIWKFAQSEYCAAEEQTEDLQNVRQTGDFQTAQSPI